MHGPWQQDRHHLQSSASCIGFSWIGLGCDLNEVRGGITRGGHAYIAGILPYPILSGNSSQRLTYVKFFINALGGDVSERDLSVSHRQPSACKHFLSADSILAREACPKPFKLTVSSNLHRAVFLASFTLQEQNLFSLPITAQIDESSTDLADWKPINFVYCSQARSSLCSNPAPYA